MYLQEYLKKPGRDIRTFVMGEMVLTLIYREAPRGQWKTNVAQGVAVQSVSLSSELQEMAIRATKAFGLLYAGVDILESSQGALYLKLIPRRVGKVCNAPMALESQTNWSNLK